MLREASIHKTKTNSPALVRLAGSPCDEVSPRAVRAFSHSMNTMKTINWAQAHKLFDAFYVGYQLPGEKEPSFVPFVFSPETEDKKNNLGAFADACYDILDLLSKQSYHRIHQNWESALVKAIAAKKSTGTISIPKIGKINWWLAKDISRNRRIELSKPSTKTLP